MAGEALFLGWGQVVRGREQLALEVFNESVAYWGKLQEDGKIERFDAYLLEPHGGDLAGFFMLHGERSALDTIRSSPEFRHVIVRAGSIVDNLGVVSAFGGDALAQQMGAVRRGFPGSAPGEVGHPRRHPASIGIGSPFASVSRRLLTQSGYRFRRDLSWADSATEHERARGRNVRIDTSPNQRNRDQP